MDMETHPEAHVTHAIPGAAAMAPTAGPFCVPDRCGTCYSDSDCPDDTRCNVEETCMVACDCPLCAVCAGDCVPTSVR